MVIAQHFVTKRQTELWHLYNTWASKLKVDLPEHTFGLVPINSWWCCVNQNRRTCCIILKIHRSNQHTAENNTTSTITCWWSVEVNKARRRNVWIPHAQLLSLSWSFAGASCCLLGHQAHMPHAVLDWRQRPHSLHHHHHHLNSCLYS